MPVITGDASLTDGPHIGLDGIARIAPRMPEVGVVAMVPEPWESPWQPRHYVLARLARYFHVVWFNPVRNWRVCMAAETCRRPGPHPAR